jgi:hypothetical protein
MEEGMRWGSVFAQASVEFVDMPSPIGPLGALEVTLRAPGAQAPATLCLGVPAARQLWEALDEAIALRAASSVSLKVGQEACTAPTPPCL